MSNLWGFTPEQMLGKPTIHIPINMIVQEANAAEGRYWGVWQCNHLNSLALTFGSAKTHQLILGDAFIRPNLVCDSDEFKGRGMASMATQAFMETELWNPIFHR